MIQHLHTPLRTSAALTALLVAAAATAGAGHAATLACGPGDMTAALNQALAGGRLALGPGLCLVSASLVVPSNTTLTGAGIGVTIVRAAPGATYPAIAVGGPTLVLGSHDVDISALSVDGGAAARGPRRSDAIWVPFGSTRVRIHGIEASRAGDNGIEVNGSDNEVSDSVVRDNYTNGIYVTGKGNLGGLHVVRAARVQVLRNRVFHNSLAKPPGSGHGWDGIDIDPITEACLVQGNTVTGNDIIVLENANVVPTSRGHQVRDNVVLDSPGNGVVVQGPETDFVISGNRIERIVGWGVVLNGPVLRGQVLDNRIGGTTREGVLIKNTLQLPGPPQDILVSGNVIRPAASGPASIAVAAR